MRKCVFRILEVSKIIKDREKVEFLYSQIGVTPNFCENIKKDYVHSLDFTNGIYYRGAFEVKVNSNFLSPIFLHLDLANLHRFFADYTKFRKIRKKLTSRYFYHHIRPEFILNVCCQKDYYYVRNSDF